MTTHTRASGAPCEAGPCSCLVSNRRSCSFRPCAPQDRSLTALHALCGVALLLSFASCKTDERSTPSTQSAEMANSASGGNSARDGTASSTSGAADVSPSASGSQSATIGPTPGNASTLQQIAFSSLTEPPAWPGLRAASELQSHDPADGTLTPAQLSLSSVAGGSDYFCGIDKGEAVVCWGKLDFPATTRGEFQAVAALASTACTLDLLGRVRCLGSELSFEDPSGGDGEKLTAIAAGGQHLCAWRENGAVKCKSPTAGTVELAGPAGLALSQVVVGEGFACGLDDAKALRCWGDSAKLNLPSVPDQSSALAAGDSFLCTLNTQGDARCYGALPAGVAAETKGDVIGIAANGGTACISRSNGTRCAGDVTAESSATTAHVGRTSVCFAKSKGVLECAGASASGQLAPPSSRRKQPSGMPPERRKARFEEFLDGFPLATLPVTFDRDSSIALGDWIDPKYAVPLLGAGAFDAPEFRYGVRISGPGKFHTVTVYDSIERELQLRIFDSNGVQLQSARIARIDREIGERVQAADTSAEQQLSVSALEATLHPDFKLTRTEHEARERRVFVKMHKDGKQPVSRVHCVLSGLTWDSQITDKGSFQRLSGKMLPGKHAVDRDGCGQTWPMPLLPSQL